jgi:hypothetical protein
MKEAFQAKYPNYLIDVTCPHCGTEQQMIDSEFTLSWLLQCKECLELFGNKLKELD